MKCINCGYEFCWICGHEWKTYEGDKYTCNQFKDLDELVAVKNESSKEDARIAHYYSRYFDHYSSMQIEKDPNTEKFSLLNFEKLLLKTTKDILQCKKRK